MPNTVTVDQVKTDLPKLLKAVILGAKFVITEAGKPIACLVPCELDAVDRTPGNDTGQVTTAPDFAPLPEFWAT